VQLIAITDFSTSSLLWLRN